MGDSGPWHPLLDLSMNYHFLLWVKLFPFSPSLSLCMIVSSFFDFCLIHVFSFSPSQLIQSTTTALLVFLVFHVLYHIACWCQGNLFFFIIYSCHTYITLNFCEWHKMPSWHSRVFTKHFLVQTPICVFLYWISLSSYFDLYKSTYGLCVFNSRKYQKNRKSFALLDSVIFYQKHGHFIFVWR